MRIIMHLDLDAFFAAVEERERPEIRGKPVIVGADPKGGKGRGVVSTANYAAREYGIYSGMPIALAWRKCPGQPKGPCIYLPVNYELYEKVSDAIFEGIVRKYADVLERVSIDEAYLDVSSSSSWAAAVRLAKAIKAEIKAKEKLTCSIGIGPNKLIAKIASGYRKPDGLTLVRPGEVVGFLAPLSVREIPGVGPKTQAVLKSFGIKTIGQLRSVPESVLVSWFGRPGRALWLAARGIDTSPVLAAWVPKSFCREHTFEKDTRNKQLIISTLKKLAKDVHSQLESLKAEFKTVTVKIRYADFETHTAQKSFLSWIRDFKAAFDSALALLEPFLKSPKAIRLIGYRLSNFRYPQMRCF